MTSALHIPTAKITPPRIGVPLLRRDRLLSEVQRGMSCKLLLISAEAGHARRREFRRAIETAQSILTLDRLHEPAYRRVMRYSLARGDRQTALFAYQTCERLLREELGVSPQPETRALLDQARSPTST